MTCHEPHSKGTGRVAQLAEHLPRTHEALGPFLTPHNLGSTGVAPPAGDFPLGSGLSSSIHYGSLLSHPYTMAIYSVRTNPQALPVASAAPDSACRAD